MINSARSSVGGDVSVDSLGMEVSASEMLASFAVISSSGHGSNSQLLLGSCRTTLPSEQERTSAEQPACADSPSGVVVVGGGTSSGAFGS